MDNFNFKNMVLAYNAVHDNVLRESMEELGFFGETSAEQDDFENWVNGLLDEGYDLSDYTWDELYEGYKKLPVGKMIIQSARKSAHALDKANKGDTKGQDKEIKDIRRMSRVAERHSTIKGKGKVRGEGQAELNRRRGEFKEDFKYDIYDLVLEYLIDEGYAESLDNAEAIMANMSEDWVLDIVEKSGYGDDDAFKSDPSAKPGFKVGRTIIPSSGGGPSRFILDRISGKHTKGPRLGGSPSRSRRVTRETPRRSESSSDIARTTIKPGK